MFLEMPPKLCSFSSDLQWRSACTDGWNKEAGKEAKRNVYQDYGVTRRYVSDLWRRRGQERDISGRLLRNRADEVTQVVTHLHNETINKPTSIIRALRTSIQCSGVMFQLFRQHLTRTNHARFACRDCYTLVKWFLPLWWLIGPASLFIFFFCKSLKFNSHSGRMFCFLFLLYICLYLITTEAGCTLTYGNTVGFVRSSWCVCMTAIVSFSRLNAREGSWLTVA